jgi:hypothetical protein
MRTDVLEERITSIFRGLKSAEQKNQRATNRLGTCFTLVFCHADFRPLKMEIIRSSETSVHIGTTWCYIPGYRNFCNYRCENLKSYMTEIVFMPYLPVIVFLQSQNSQFLSRLILTQKCYIRLIGYC